MSDDGEYKCHVLKTATEPGIKTDPASNMMYHTSVRKYADMTYILK
jgi:predicted AAA+ superfamily ATPase